MALHTSPSSLIHETIQDCLTGAKVLLEVRKEDGGYLGYPACLQLFAVVNALGTIVVGDSITAANGRKTVTSHEPYLVLNHEIFGLQLRFEEIKALEKCGRNPLAHDALLGQWMFLVPSNDLPEFAFFSERIEIRVFSFYDLVQRAWERLDKTRLGRVTLQVPRIDFSRLPGAGVASVPPAASGCMLVDPKYIRKM